MATITPASPYQHHPWQLLGFKDLGTNVFRTVMCNVDKSWSKQVI